jgi:hypothetical protein
MSVKRSLVNATSLEMNASFVLGVKAKNIQIVRRASGWLLERRKSFPGGNSEWEPPDPISNSEVKTLCADDSVAVAMRK